MHRSCVPLFHFLITPQIGPSIFSKSHMEDITPDQRLSDLCQSWIIFIIHMMTLFEMLKTSAPTHPLGRWRCWAQAQVLPWTRPSPACRQGCVNKNKIKTPACRCWRVAPQKLGTAQSSNPGPAIWEVRNADGEITVIRGMELWSLLWFPW